MSEAFEKAKKALSIKTVCLKDSFVSLGDDVEVSDLENSVAGTQTFRGVQRVKETSIQSGDNTTWEYHFFYSCGIRLVKEDSYEPEGDIDEPEGDNDEVLAEIRATFNAIYSTKNRVKKELIEAFSEENVGYHVWPYWREYVQSSCSRLNIPLLETPFYFCKPNKEATG